jgi:hypothetical protein
MKIGFVVGMTGWFLKVSGGQVKTSPADFHIKKAERGRAGTNHRIGGA